MVSYFLMFWKVHWLFVSFAYHYCRINAYLSLQLAPISNGFCEVILFVQQGHACVMFKVSCCVALLCQWWFAVYFGEFIVCEWLESLTVIFYKNQILKPLMGWDVLYLKFPHRKSSCHASWQTSDFSVQSLCLKIATINRLYLGNELGTKDSTKKSNNTTSVFMPLI